MSQDISVAIVSGNELAREGLRRILVTEDFTVVAAASSATSLMPCVSDDSTLPRLIIIDESADLELVGCCTQLHKRFPDAKLVLMSDDHSVNAITKAMATGIDGYLAKQIGCEPLVGALRLVAMGEKIVPSQTVCALTAKPWRSVGSDWLNQSDDVHLSEREREILRCLTRGDANKIISRQLTITEATVKVHIKAILRKLSVMNRTQAAIWAVAHSLADMPGPRIKPGIAVNGYHGGTTPAL